MFENFYKTIRDIPNPFRNIMPEVLKSLLRGLFVIIFSKRKKRTLIYLGMNEGKGFDFIFMDYNQCYGFEANPEIAQFLKKKYKFCKNVEIIHGALTDKTESYITFNISNNSSYSSSIGEFKEEWLDMRKKVHNQEIKISSQVKVPSINLNHFLKERNIDFIDTYISDIEGMDLQVLKTIKSYIDKKKIENITCEVNKDKYGNLHKNLPDNTEQGFHNLLDKNYELIAKGEGILESGKFEENSIEDWTIDCMWKVKE